MAGPIILVFSRARYAGGPVSLVFGGEGADTENPPALPLTLEATVALGGPVVSCTAVYDNRNPLRVSNTVASDWQRGASAAVQPQAVWAKPAAASGEPSAHWQGSSNPVEASPRAAWPSGKPIQGDSAAVWQTGKTRAAQVDARHQAGQPADLNASLDWRQGQPKTALATAPHQVGVFTAIQIAAEAGAALPLAVLLTAPHQVGRAVAWQLFAPWQQARKPPPGLTIKGQPATPTVRVPDLNLVFCRSPYAGGPVELVFGRVCGGGNQPALIVIPVRSTYMAQNSVILYRMPAGTEFEASNFTLDIDSGSWTFGWSASLHSSARAHLVRSPATERVEVQTLVNGQSVNLTIDSVGRDRSFPTDRIAVRGRGMAAELSEVSLNFGNTAARTAQQLMADVLTVNGVSFGWSIDWQIEDWLVPANAWLHQGSYISALQDIAGAAGAYLQPHLTDKVIRVLPRYKEAPWDWATLLTPDIEMPVEATSVENTEEVIKPAYNRVFVGGVAVGVFGPVDRDGTAGDVLAPPVTHALITDATAHRQRGLAELSDTGLQVHHTLKGLLLPETGIIMPGKVLRYVTEEGSKLGIVRKTNINMSQWPVMHQTLGVETHVE